MITKKIAQTLLCLKNLGIEIKGNVITVDVIDEFVYHNYIENNIRKQNSFSIAKPYQGLEVFLVNVILKEVELLNPALEELLRYRLDDPSLKQIITRTPNVLAAIAEEKLKEVYSAKKSKGVIIVPQLKSEYVIEKGYVIDCNSQSSKTRYTKLISFINQKGLLLKQDREIV